MAVTKKQLANLRPIKKGQVLNPNGARAHNPATKALKNLTIETYREVIELVLTGNLQALRDMRDNENIPAIQVGVARAFYNAIKCGDYGVIERIAERIVGKIPDQLVLNSTLQHGPIDREKLKLAMAELENDV